MAPKFNFINNNQNVYISKWENKWHINGKEIVLPIPSADVLNFAIGQKYIYVIFADREGDKMWLGIIPHAIYVFDFNGNYIWNVGEISEKVTSAIQSFIYIKIHTSSTLKDTFWNDILNLDELNEEHEYLQAYDGGQEWLFDITVKKYIHRTFTH